ncbi:MAG: hypothetical protein ACHRHE_13120 [Tepidisphaerales bacterium]
MKRLLVVVVVLQGLILFSQWGGSGPVAPAYAQIPDAGAQRREVIEELKSLNSKMDKLIETLESGKVQVKATLPEEKK